MHYLEKKITVNTLQDWKVKIQVRNQKAVFYCHKILFETLVSTITESISI